MIRDMPDAMLSLLLILLGAGAALVLAATLLVMRIVLHPPRMTDGKALHLLGRLSPADLDMPYEPLDFHVRDVEAGGTFRIAGWWIPRPHSAGDAADDKCVVLLHGFGDAKVGAIAWAPIFHELGWNILAIDLRAHGESGGRRFTAGWFEREDVDQLLNDLRARRPRQTRHMVVFGPSVGAAVAAAVTERRDDVAAVIMECPYTDFAKAVEVQGRRAGLPGGFIQRMGARLAEWISGARFAEVAPLNLIPRLRCPLMIIQSGCDEMVPPPDAAAIEQAALSRPAEAGPTIIWKIPEAHHLAGLAVDPEGYRRRIGQFLHQAIAAQKTTAAPASISDLQSPLSDP